MAERSTGTTTPLDTFVDVHLNGHQYGNARLRQITSEQAELIDIFGRSIALKIGSDDKFHAAFAATTGVLVLFILVGPSPTLEDVAKTGMEVVKIVNGDESEEGRVKGMVFLFWASETEVGFELRVREGEKELGQRIESAADSTFRSSAGWGKRAAPKMSELN